MSTKTTFKRIALVAVAALGLGVLSVAPTQAAAGVDETLTLSAASATVTVGDTATVTLTNTYTAQLAVTGIAVVDSSVIHVAGSGAGGAIHARHTSDSANTTATGSVKQVIVGSAAYTDNSGIGAGIVESSTAVTAVSFTKATITVKFYQVTTPGVYVYTFSSRNAANTVINKTVSFTLTVAADAGLTTSATTTKTYINGLAEYNSIPAAGSGAAAFTTVNGSLLTNALKADSALVVTAGTAASPTKTAVLWGEVRNAADTKVVSAATQTRLTDSITVVISGPGFLATSATGVSHGSAAQGTNAKQVTINSLDSVIVYADGTAGTATITSYLGASVNVSNVLSTPKTIIFNGRAVTFTPTVSSLIMLGSNIPVSDSVTAGTAIVTFIAKDSASNNVSDAALSVSQGMGAFYAVSSDTKVVRAVNSATSQFLTCTYATTKWSCNGNVLDSGTVTLTIQDSTTGTAPYSSAAVSVTVAGSGYTGTIALDKATYNVGERALITITSKDSAGRTVGNGASTPFGNVSWGTTAPVFGVDSSSNAAGGTVSSTGSLTTYLSSGTSFISGTDTVMVFMPTTAGTYTLNGTTGSSTTVGSILTFTVVDPVATAAADTAAANAAAAAKATAAAKDASDAATDAALEATDAAYAATDAANIAAEAADAATAAAEAATEAANAAKESADAATAAVEELATSVAKLMAALQAQITTLAKVVAKIAVKVKA